MTTNDAGTRRQPAAMAMPGDAVPERHATSARRTSHIDMLLHVDGLTLAGAARDLVSAASSATVVASAAVTAEVDSAGELASLDLGNSSLDGNLLLGRLVGPGFRKCLETAFPDELAATTPLALLLDDLPVAALISGYAKLYTGAIPTDHAATSMKADICSGWREGGTMLRSVRAGFGVPVTIGPAAPELADERSVDRQGWHDLPPLPAGAMRRRRLLDVQVTDQAWQVTAMFRDTHRDGDGGETILHEYSLTAVVEATTGRFTRCAAVPQVLPWVECPVAAASADRLVGERAADVRSFVRSALRGTSTCTHLNDLLRSLSDVPALAELAR